MKLPILLVTVIAINSCWLQQHALAAKPNKSKNQSSGQVESDSGSDSDKATVESADVHCDRGIELAKQGKHEQALKEFNKASKLDPTMVEPYLQRSVLYRQETDLDSALANLNKLIKIDPKCARAYVMRAEIYKDFRQFDEAVKDLTTAIMADPSKAVQNYCSRGCVYQEGLNDSANAEKDFKDAIALKPNDGVLHFNLARLYRSAGKNDQALVEYDKAESLAPKNEKIYLELAAFYEDKLAQPVRAMLEYDKLIKEVPQSYEGYFRRAIIRLALNKNEQAIADLDETIRLNPKYASAYKARAQALRSVGKLELSRKDEQTLQELTSAQPAGI
jgi:tetratricopeptide (TPR) repeat protein